MICVNVESHFCNLTILFCAFVWIPFGCVIRSVLSFFAFVFHPHHCPDNVQGCPEWEPDLLTLRFQDSRLGNKSGAVHEKVEVECSICLMEFEGEDEVSELARCGHTFHVGCMEKWLDRCRFTCPLCRTSVLRAGFWPCTARGSAVCVVPDVS